MDNIVVQDFTCNGECSNCGQCCSNLLPMSRKEIKRIKAYIKKHHIKEQRHNGIMGVDMTCPFRDEANKKCLIYEVRPCICQLFICNQTHDVMLKNKIRCHNTMQPTAMRHEFFGSKEDIEWLKA